MMGTGDNSSFTTCVSFTGNFHTYSAAGVGVTLGDVVLRPKLAGTPSDLGKADLVVQVGEGRRRVLKDRGQRRALHVRLDVTLTKPRQVDKGAIEIHKLGLDRSALAHRVCFPRHTNNERDVHSELSVGLFAPLVELTQLIYRLVVVEG